MKYLVILLALMVSYQSNSIGLRPRIHWYIPRTPLKIPIRLPNLHLFFNHHNQLRKTEAKEPGIPTHQRARDCLKNNVLLGKKKSMLLCLLKVVRKEFLFIDRLA